MKKVMFWVVLGIGISLTIVFFIEKKSFVVYEPTNSAVKAIIDKLARVSVYPEIPHRFDIMQPGVLQHLDRRFTYDTVPGKLLNGILFQGIHEPVEGTHVEVELLVPADIYFFFHYKVNGGYSDIFPELDGWERSEQAPQYDIHNGMHGLRMIMYHLEGEAGIYQIPPTVTDKACFSIVFQPREPLDL